MFTNPTTAERLGALLLRERGIAGLAQQAVAERVGVDRTSLSKWERGTRTATLAQADEVLGCYGLRLSMAVEPKPDPELLWSAEVARLAALTPAQRLEESGLRLVDLVRRLREQGEDLVVDGGLAAWLLGVPERPRWIGVVVTHTQIRRWRSMWLTFKKVLDEDLMIIYGADAEWMIERGGALLDSFVGVLEVRVVPDGELPASVRVDVGADCEVAVRLSPGG
jgi:transcriptional regulator with XRE-family HTH domain